MRNRKFTIIADAAESCKVCVRELEKVKGLVNRRRGED
jgi:hypothetical protein